MATWKSWPAATSSGASVISTAGVLSDTSPESTATQVLPFWKPSLTVSGLSPQSLDSGASPSPVAGSLAWAPPFWPGGGCWASWALTMPITPSSAPATTATISTRRLRKLRAPPPSVRSSVRYDRDGDGPACGISDHLSHRWAQPTGGVRERDDGKRRPAVGAATRYLRRELPHRPPGGTGRAKSLAI